MSVRLLPVRVTPTSMEPLFKAPSKKGLCVHVARSSPDIQTLLTLVAGSGQSLALSGWSLEAWKAVLTQARKMINYPAVERAP